MSSPQPVPDAFERAVVAFDIRFKQQLASRWESLESEAREAIVSAPPAGKKTLLRRFFDNAGRAIAAVIHECFPNLLDVATAHPERLAGQTPLTWTEAKILTQLCNFLGMDETFDENVAPRDDSRVLSTAQRISTGVGWLDDGSPDEFLLPGWARNSRFARLLAGEPVASRPESATEPLSRADTLNWVKHTEFWIWKKLKHKIEDESLDGMIEAGKTRPSKQPKSTLSSKVHDFGLWMNDANLTARQRKCFSLKMEYCLPVAEIARRLGITRPTVDDHVAAAHRKIDQARRNQTAARKRAKDRQE